LIRVLVLGGNGQLGTELSRSAKPNLDLVFCGSKQVDVTNEQSVSEAFNFFKPDWVVNAAAYTAVDRAEDEEEFAVQVNTIGACIVAKACSLAGIKLVHVSTDFVFGESSGRAIPPDAQIIPMSVYGKTKADGEALVLKECPNSVIVRTSWLYSSHSPCFLRTMIRLMNERDSLGVVSDQIGTPTACNTLANWILASVENEYSGIYHVSDLGVASWYDFAKAIYDIGQDTGLITSSCKINPILTIDYPTAAVRPFFSVLATEKSYSLPGADFGAHWRDTLEKTMKEIIK